MQDQPSRPRRNRRSQTVRSAVQENSLSPSNFILPLFVHEGAQNQPIPSMPGVERLSFENGLTDFVAEARSYGVNQVVVFPKVGPASRVRTVSYTHLTLPTTPYV